MPRTVKALNKTGQYVPVRIDHGCGMFPGKRKPCSVMVWAAESKFPYNIDRRHPLHPVIVLDISKEQTFDIPDVGVITVANYIQKLCDECPHSEIYKAVSRQNKLKQRGA